MEVGFMAQSMTSYVSYNAEFDSLLTSANGTNSMASPPHNQRYERLHGINFRDPSRPPTHSCARPRPANGFILADESVGPEPQPAEGGPRISPGRANQLGLGGLARLPRTDGSKAPAFFQHIGSERSGLLMVVEAFGR
ncbi:hypothetical protein BBK36DRAFT_1201016 [Trichoderma citrinoviride]|uniref:Uncharacterized protein n=1 Tax=Trichoderma citrinoviride TaxID=58853 RepID=A0A2T4BAY8_9HYPO|nr:hypothetical protein BBK36DRAFT_1201016 [Trichoderma citrinoviride]PTB66401.1 hypothetical protein BBK36DRAFT_1201016 [Trichoderma citrinoviride]